MELKSLAVRKVFLVGTCHDYQLLGEFSKVTKAQLDEFIEMLRDVIERDRIRSTGEEMTKRL
jgi:hypothetical protein